MAKSETQPAEATNPVEIEGTAEYDHKLTDEQIAAMEAAETAPVDHTAAPPVTGTPEADTYIAAQEKAEADVTGITPMPWEGNVQPVEPATGPPPEQVAKEETGYTDTKTLTKAGTTPTSTTGAPPETKEG